MTRIRQFLKEAPEGAARVLQALAAAESLTDRIAKVIYEIAPIEKIPAELFLEALHQSEFVIPRNSEWYFSSLDRAELKALTEADEGYLAAVHGILLKEGLEGDRTLAGDEIPSYLFTKAGQAYHKAALGDIDGSLELYSDVAASPASGEQWLAGILAEEQQNAGLLPGYAVQPAFLRGMSFYRERDYQKAEQYLSQVATRGYVIQETAIAYHILGVIRSRRSMPDEALSLLDKSVSINSALQGSIGLVMVLNSRGGVKRDLGDLEGALEDLNRAAELADGRSLVIALNSRSMVKRDLGDLEGELNDLDQLRQMSRDRHLGIDLRKINTRHHKSRNTAQHLMSAKTNEERSDILCRFYLDNAKTYLSAKETAQALHSFRKATEYCKDEKHCAECKYGIGKSYFKLNQPDSASKYLRDAIESGCAQSDALAMLAYSLTLIGKDLNITEKIYNDAIRADNKNPWPKSWLALALSDAGRHKEAEEYARASALVPPGDKNAVLLFNLARVLDKSNDQVKRAEAVNFAKMAMTYSRPGFAWPRRFLMERGAGGKINKSE